jgi:hypothetical protein
VTDVVWGTGLSFTATFIDTSGVSIRTSFKLLQTGVLSETLVEGQSDPLASRTITWRNVLLP